MCGIAGFAHSDLSQPDAGALLHQMTDIIRHRGPDDDGFWYGDGVGLGMRRLSIIDVSGGQQPITNEDGSIIVILNGEIYNYQQLRAELEQAGHRFTTNSDTETIVHAYEDDGLEFVHRLRGMFAIALWDRQRQRLVLARDRFGKKPLHYAFDGRHLVFGSEIKSVLLAPGIVPKLDTIALNQYLTFGYIAAPRTAFQGIEKLPPGHVLTLENGKLAVKRYWHLDFTPTCFDDEEKVVHRLRALLEESVRLRLISEVPLGAFLSGGIDSSLVVGLMSRVGNEQVKTFSIGFEEESYSELAHARRIAAHFHTDHHEFIVRPDLVNVLPQLVWDFDEPFADPSMVPTYYVARLARAYVTVALSGDGGDELYGGYARYSRALEDMALARKLGPARALAGVASALLPDGVKGKRRLSTLASDPAAHYVNLLACFPTTLRTQVLLPDIAAEADDLSASILAALQRRGDLDFYTRMQQADVETYLPDDILVKVDKTSMFASLEARAPLLDHVLAEYVASLPREVRNRGYEQKYLLKKAVRDLLPEETMARRKQGFAMPIDRWLRGPLKEMTYDVLLSQSARTRGVFNGKEIERLLAGHQHQMQNLGQQIWALLCYELWCRMYLDGNRPALTEGVYGQYGQPDQMAVAGLHAAGSEQ